MHKSQKLIKLGQTHQTTKIYVVITSFTTALLNLISRLNSEEPIIFLWSFFRNQIEILIQWIILNLMISVAKGFRKKWKSGFRCKFFNENWCTNVVLYAQNDDTKILVVWRHLVVKILATLFRTNTPSKIVFKRINLDLITREIIH